MPGNSQRRGRRTTPKKGAVGGTGRQEPGLAQGPGPHPAGRRAPVAQGLLRHRGRCPSAPPGSRTRSGGRRRPRAGRPRSVHRAPRTPPGAPVSGWLPSPAVGSTRTGAPAGPARRAPARGSRRAQVNAREGRARAAGRAQPGGRGAARADPGHRALRRAGHRHRRAGHRDRPHRRRPRHRRCSRSAGPSWTG